MQKAFHVLDYLAKDDADVILGDGSLTEGRSGTIYLPDDSGIWQPFTSGVPGRVYANGQWWLYGGPAGTNQLIRSYDLADAAWAETGSNVAVLDAVGMRGEANDATTLTDDDSGSPESVNDTVTCPNDSNTNTFRSFIRKDSDEIRFPSFRYRLSGGAAQSDHLHINTKTGAFAEETGSVFSDLEVNDAGDWWEVLVSLLNDSSGNTSCLIYCYPARGIVFGVSSSAAIGSCIIGNMEIHLNKTIAQVRGTTPIFTSGSTESVNASDPNFDDANHSDTEGAYFCEFRNVGIDGVNDAGLIGLGTAGRILYSTAANGFKALDGVNTASGPVVTLAADDVEYKIGLAYGSSKQRINTNDSWGAEATYDGVYNNAENKLNVLHDDVTTSAPEGVMLVRNLRRYNMTYAEALIAIPKMMNGIFPPEDKFYIAITRRKFDGPPKRISYPKPTRGLFR